jgi:pimeloyl-ACP methyl ester carboxylesterase
MSTNPTELDWRWDGTAVRVGVTRLGSGPIVVLLPAVSSVSSRGEMRPLQERLAGSFETVAVDWPGFGAAPRPRADWRPETYRAFLAHLFGAVFPRPHATVAAGHSATYLLGQAADAPGSAGRLCLVAPTWRGPFPTMLGRYHPALPLLARAVDVPVIGPLLYAINVNKPMMRRMGRGHVYADPGWMSESKVAEKLAITRAPGARHAAGRFVTGQLDPVRSREAFLMLAGRVADPVLVVIPAAMPPKSRAEAEALAALPNVHTARLQAGKLLVHEEFPDQVAEAIRGFLGA